MNELLIKKSSVESKWKTIPQYHQNLFDKFLIKGFVYQIYSKRKIGCNVLLNRLNNYHPNIKLTIELNHSKVLDTKLTSISMDLKKIGLVVYVILVNLSVMQKIIMKIIIQLKVQNHRNTFETISTTVLYGLIFQILQKMLKPGSTQRHRMEALRKPYLNEQKDFERLVLFRNDAIQSN